MPEQNKGTAASEAVEINIAAVAAENAELKSERDALKKVCIDQTRELKDLRAKVESDSRELMYPAIQAKFDMTRAELDQMPLGKIREMRESVARINVASAPSGRLNSVIASVQSDAARSNGIPDLYGKTPQQVQELVNKL